MENTITKEVYRKLEDGSMELVSTEQVTVEGPSVEEQIAQKEADLLQMYADLEALKASQE
jgi:hypothetical protein